MLGQTACPELWCNGDFDRIMSSFTDQQDANLHGVQTNYCNIAM